MVALDFQTNRPTPVPPLNPDPEDAQGEKQRRNLAMWNKARLKHRRETSMLLRERMSIPPTPEEMRGVHELHRIAAQAWEEGNSRQVELVNSRQVELVRTHTHSVCQTIFPEGRNVHGALFGGYIMHEGFDIAHFAAKYFMGGDPIAIGLDEAVFVQPVAVGDMLKFTARVVHVACRVVRVNVVVEVLHPDAFGPGRVADALNTNFDGRVVGKRSNRMMFLFLHSKKGETTDGCLPQVVPDSYKEILMHVDALRRQKEEGPTEEFISHHYGI
eukprot:CAMPEP_0114536474 /NCGR_PEP_ID=MMETSP0109-20121206/29028_1 /TAXON_ID=29199 /ORGANISM="Chlorarachnion reptans, Strain CCCM449" /LENGTH=271 /DNA_ID=CAMNT_0001720227 /DNA_START=1 /DNA_END=816 /DNA_ORIENTATION=-